MSVIKFPGGTDAVVTMPPSQVVKSAMFKLWLELNRPGRFEDFYIHELERIIDQLYAKLNHVNRKQD